MTAGSRLGKGLFDGVTGIVSQPIQGAQKSGIGGFLKGVVKGTVGLAVKPITGVVDAATTMVEGIQSTAVSEIHFSRARNPRMIYGKDNCLREYDIDAANAAAALRELEIPGICYACVPMSNSFLVMMDRELVFISKTSRSSMASVSGISEPRYVVKCRVHWTGIDFPCAGFICVRRAFQDQRQENRNQHSFHFV